MNLRRIRAFLMLGLKDVEMGAGVPAYRLSKAEYGKIRLNEAEQRSLLRFYADRWRMAVGDEHSLPEDHNN